jgi:glucose-1-phosphate thymidylyltransferase
MKGLILAGGTGSRLFPLTKVTNKHLLPVGRKPMIVHAIDRLKQADTRQIMIVTGVEHMDAVVGLLGSGREWGCEFTYRVQDEAGGIAQAIGLARNFVHDGRVIVILGDNVFQDDISGFVGSFRRQKAGAKILLKEVRDPQRFGVAELRNGKVVGIEEKPRKPKSNLAVTGIYMYDGQVFDIISKLKPSARGELEVTDINNAYLRKGQLTYDVLKGWWTDAGTFESYKLANELMFAQEFHA